MTRMTAKDFDPELLELYDFYCSRNDVKTRVS